MNSRGPEWLLLVCGVILIGSFGAHLNGSGRLKHSQNPLAIQRSGYGMVLARLSQNSVNKAWHYGLEEHGSHKHEHGDDCAVCEHRGNAGNHAGEASYYTSQGEAVPSDHLVSVAGLPPGAAANEKSIVERALSRLLDLKKATYSRTNPTGLSKAHRSKVTADIEGVLLRSYKMDPTDYGVYNAYYLFLTSHDLRVTHATDEQAKRVAGMTVTAAMGEKENPFPWLTAASALLDEFFLDNQVAHERGISLPVAVVEDYKEKMACCLARFKALREVAIAEQRWQGIGEERISGAEERLRFLERASEQFTAILARESKKRVQANAGGEN